LSSSARSDGSVRRGRHVEESRYPERFRTVPTRSEAASGNPRLAATGSVHHVVSDGVHEVLSRRITRIDDPTAALLA
jgi:hypothetical protein